MRKLIFVFWAVVLGVWLVCGKVFASSARPVALVGASYGTYELTSILKNAINISPHLEYVFQQRGEWMPPEEFGNYSLVIVAHSVARPLSPEENEFVANYVKDGGHILLISNAPNSLAGQEGLARTPWMGLKRVSWVKNGLPCAVRQPNHPFLVGVFEEDAKPRWLMGATVALVSPDGAENIIGAENGNAIFALHRFGKGWVVFLGHELFRLRMNMREDSESYVRLIRNIIREAGPLTNAQLREEGLQKYRAAGRKWLLWTREWQGAEAYGPRFTPPLPEENELISSLSADMALDEYESLQLNFTPIVELGEVSWKIVSNGFPLGNVEFFVQDRPDPIPWPKDPKLAQEFPYWLMPPEYVEPRGKPEFSTKAGETRILWLRVSSFGLAPGEHEFALHLAFAHGGEVRVPVRIRLYPVRLLEKRLITLGPGGAAYGEVGDPTPAARFMKDLQIHGFEWCLLTAPRLEMVRVRGEIAKLDRAYFTSNNARFEQGDFPTLDLSFLDAWLEQALKHNLTRIHTPNVDYYFGGALANLSEEGKEKARIWFCREVARHLREKGFRVLVARLGDEMDEKELRERWLPWAKRMTDAGWGCSSTFSGMHHLDPKLNEALWPYVKLWTFNRQLAPNFITKLRQGELKVREDAIIGTYGAGAGLGTEHRKPLSHSRFLGWESWMWGIRDCFPNPYFKGWLYYVDYATRDLGIAGERWVSYIKKDDLSAPLADCPFLEGVREGMEEGNLCAILSWYLERMEKTEFAQRAKQVRSALEHVLGSSENALVRWREVPIRDKRYSMRQIIATNDDFRAGKRKILELLTAIREDAIRSVKPSLYWNDLLLIEEGRPLAAIYPGEVQFGALSEAMENLCGVKIPVLKGATSLDPRYPVAILIGNGLRNTLTAALVKEHRLRDADAEYPGKGSYFIEELSSSHSPRGKMLILAGADAEGDEKGMRAFATFLRSEGNWLVP